MMTRGRQQLPICGKCCANNAYDLDVARARAAGGEIVDYARAASAKSDTPSGGTSAPQLGQVGFDVTWAVIAPLCSEAERW